MDRLLALGFFYNAFIYIIGKFNFAKLILFSKYIPYTPGEKVLDLGCGPATNTSIFNSNDYFGIDISDTYIKTARKLFPKYSFLKSNFLSLNGEYDDSFDLILMSGLLHHLTDEMALEFTKKACKLLKIGGHLITIDNCLHSQQSKFKQKIILRDRGKFVRGIDALKALIPATNFVVTSHIEEDLLLIPYTHLILVCKKHC